MMPLPDTTQSPVPDDGPIVLKVRTVWVSDLHLGTSGCQADALLEFLRATECQTLYLVGNIVDGWQLRRTMHWPQAHNDVVRQFLSMVRKGTRVVFVPGNHDGFARRYIQSNLGGVDVAEEAIHVTADGRRLWVTHGDLFDGVVQRARWLAHADGVACETALEVNRWLNRARARLGLPRWSLARHLKEKAKRPVRCIDAFEVAVARAARRRGAHGVVCGHIHHPGMREIGGVLYCNDGDWIDSMTALVEYHDGRLEIIDRGNHGPRPTPQPAPVRQPVPVAAAPGVDAPVEPELALAEWRALGLI
jgi:UDP-2,3-diacylglucosamine pyrophosphatase LpxH